MRVFLAGATGAIGRPLVPMLLEAGHEVTGMTRSEAGAAAVRAAGAEAVIGDALDAESTRRAAEAARPEAVVHQLTAIPAKIPPRGYGRAMAPTNRLRTEGTRNLLEAARVVGASRMVAQSIAFAYRPEGEGLNDEDQPLWSDPPAEFKPVVAALAEHERAVTEDADVAGTVLRYGYFYGPGTSYAPDGQFTLDARKRRLPIVGKGTGVFSFVHVDDAAAAAVQAVERGTPSIFNVVDDQPAPVSEWAPHLAHVLGAKPPRRIPVSIARIAAGPMAIAFMTRQRGASNARAKRELGLELRHPSWRQGFEETLGSG